MQNKYIKEIQSLRGLSVIFVFLFHINQDIFSFGYVGVDIFFVISGFVITKIIYENVKKENFNIKIFKIISCFIVNDLIFYNFYCFNI